MGHLQHQVGAIGGLIGKLFDDPEKKINPIRQAFVDAAGGLEMLNARAHDAGVTLDRVLNAKTPEQYTRAIEDLQAAFAFQDQAMKTLDETVQKYGFSIEQLGPALQRQELGKQAQELFQDWSVLHTAGVDQVAITQAMSDKVSQYVQDAVRMGLEIPAAMKPMLQNFADMGDLIDENGNKITDLASLTFAETMSEGFDRVVDSVNELIKAIERGLNPAIANVAPIVVPVIYDDPGFDPGNRHSVPGFASGTNGEYVDFGRGTPVMLHGKERVMTEAEGRNDANLAAEIQGLRGDFGHWKTDMFLAMRDALAQSTRH